MTRGLIVPAFAPDLNAINKLGAGTVDTDFGAVRAGATDRRRRQDGQGGQKDD